jgi:DNA polymerase III epsilon subunit-like protein
MIDLSRVLCIDLEASGLHEGSFPIELGWAGPDGRSGAWLIRPAAEWTLEDWDEDAEAVHGISWDELQRGGVAPRDVAEAFLRIITGPAQLQLVSDAAATDQRWLERLFDHTPHPAPHITEAVTFARRLRGAAAPGRLLAEIDSLPRPHRAEADARALRAALEATLGGDRS